MASKFIFIRHGQLTKPYSNHLRMGYFELANLASGKADPGLAGNAKELFHKQSINLNFSKVEIIYYNNSGKQSRRSFESAKIIAAILKKNLHKTISLKGLADIHEINFDLKAILPLSIFKREGMPSLRSALYYSILNGGRHSESVKSLNKRIDKIQSVIRYHARNRTDALFVTHDFFMKFLEMHIKSRQSFSGLTILKLNQTKLNLYFGGYITNDKMTKILKKFGE